MLNMLLKIVIVTLFLIPLNISGKVLYDNMESETAKFNAAYWTGFLAFLVGMLVNVALA